MTSVESGCQTAVPMNFIENEKMKNGLLRIAAECWIIHETLNH